MARYYHPRQCQRQYTPSGSCDSAAKAANSRLLHGRKRYLKSRGAFMARVKPVLPGEFTLNSAVTARHDRPYDAAVEATERPSVAGSAASLLAYRSMASGMVTDSGCQRTSKALPTAAPNNQPVPASGRRSSTGADEQVQPGMRQ